MMTKLFSVLFFLFLISPTFSNSGIFQQLTTKVPSKSRNPLSNSCVNMIRKSSVKCTENATIKWHGTDQDQNYCCSLWDIADCVHDSVQQKCSAIDILKNKLSLQQLIQLNSAIGCFTYTYHSEKCGYKSNDLATTPDNENESSNLSKTTHLKIQPTNLPYSNDCKSLISKVGVQCRDEIIGKHNLSIVYSKMLQAQNQVIDEDYDNCCNGWESVLCIERRIKLNCTKEEVSYFINMTSEELNQLNCPGLKECNLDQDFPPSIGSILTLVNCLLLLNVMTTILH